MEFEYRYTDNCVFKDACPRQERIGCSVDCTIQPEFYYLLHTSNIPEQYKKKQILYPSNVDVKTFEILGQIKEDIEIFVEEGRFLYLWGEVAGNSKTSWACKLMKTYLASICIGNQFMARAWFEYVPSFLLSAKNFENREEGLQRIEALTNRDLVVLDDIGAVHNTQYDTIILSDIINNRYSNGKATIITSNIAPETLSSSLNRITDRMCSDIVLELRGKGRRNSKNTYKRLGENE